jgi:gamma-glutamyl-gamma-aminobutyrate hydrolase PuuD
MMALENNRNEFNKPIIAINVDFSGGLPRDAKINDLYLNAIDEAGGIALLVPPMVVNDLRYVLRKVDGVMLIGGLDYDPQLYGQKKISCVDITDPERNIFDFQLARTVIAETDLPILGICAGSQIMNIGLGGDLIQDIHTNNPESNVIHSSPDGWVKGFNRHRVRLVAGSKLWQIYGQSELDVPTSHHQSVAKLGSELIAAAHADDGTIEAIERPGTRFVLGVQWHPERDYEGNRNLFEQLVHEARLRCQNQTAYAAPLQDPSLSVSRFGA